MIEIDSTPLTEIRALAAKGVPAWLCVDPVEYHGPHLSLLNDQIIADGLMRESHELIRAQHPDWPLVYAGQLGVGMDTVPGPGTVDVPFREILRQTRTALGRLVDLGFGRIILMTFHGSPFHNAALWEAALELQKRGIRVLAPMNLLTRQIITPNPDAHGSFYNTVRDPEDRARMRARANEDFHAGFGETSLALHFAPQTVTGHEDVPSAPALTSVPFWRKASQLAARFGRAELARELEFVGLGTAWFALRPFPGYSCEPALATAESGAALAKLIVEGMVDAVEAVLVRGEPAPPPVLRWVSRLTMGGLFGRSHPPLRDCTYQSSGQS